MAVSIAFIIGNILQPCRFLPFVIRVAFYFFHASPIELNTSLRSRGHESVMGRFSWPKNGKSPRRGSARRLRN
jgi:hypothetical protein